MFKKNYYNLSFVFFVLIFLGISLISIYSALMYLSPTLGNLALKQLIWYLIGFIIIFIILKLDNDFFYDKAYHLYILNVILLLGLLFFAPSINGSKCWYVIGGFSIQPSEFMKISLVLVNARIIDKYYKKRKVKTLMDELKLILTIFVLFLIPALLTFLEPDTGAVFVYFAISLLMLFTSGIKIRWFYILLAIIILFVTGFLSLYFLNQDLFINVFGSSFFYRMDRLINWNSGSGMQLENALAAIGSSGLTGHGFNNTPIYFPEAGTDFIFAIFASNFGFLGSLLVILIILLFDVNILKSALKQNNTFNKSLVIGVASIFIYQQIQNIAMVIGLMPIIGITLPFISYGGSSILSYMILIGLLLNATKRKRLIKN